MPDKFSLAAEFVEIYPKQAARVLEELAPESSSQFIDAVPDKQSSNIISMMLPYHAAKCLTSLPPHVAARYLAPLDARTAAGILRHVEKQPQAAIVAELPRRQSTRIAIIMNYPLSTAGAWADPTVITLPLDCSVGEAKARLGKESYTDFHRVYVLDDQQNLKGSVRLFDLLRATDETRLSDHVVPVRGTIPANASLDIVLDDPGWADSDFMPVLDRRGKFLGALRHAVLRTATTRPQTATGGPDVSATFLDMAEACYLGLAEVVNSSLSKETADGQTGQTAQTRRQ